MAEKEEKGNKYQKNNGISVPVRICSKRIGLTEIRVLFVVRTQGQCFLPDSRLSFYSTQETWPISDHVRPDEVVSSGIASGIPPPTCVISISAVHHVISNSKFDKIGHAVMAFCLHGFDHAIIE